MAILIHNAEVNGQPSQDVLIRAGRIEAIGNSIPANSAEVIDARGGALLPGLKDHHIHLAALAVARYSVRCGPAEVGDASGLAEALQQRAAEQPDQWIRGIGYHESVAGDIDAAWLDARLPNTPARIQHRGGRLWIFNSAALQRLQLGNDHPLQCIDGRLTGRLYEADDWLRQRMAELGQGGFPDLAAVSRELASYGITGVTDTSPRNNTETLQFFQQAKTAGRLLQDIRVMGDASLDGVESSVDGVSVGEHKFHLLESQLPDLDAVIAAIRQSHAHGRNVAFHCVTRTELAFALAAITEAGSRPGDRIEHASITPPELLEQIVALGLIVVVQPALVAERGDQYLADVEAAEQPWLYRLRALRDAGLPLAGSSDAPYTHPNPWPAMQAAVSRQTTAGNVLGGHEALSPDQALAMYTAPLHNPGRPVTKITNGMPADLCLLDRSWPQASENLAALQPLLSLRLGEVIYRANIA